MGTKLKIHTDESGAGSVNEEEVPFVKGATLKFEGCDGDVKWSEIKVITIPIYIAVIFSKRLTTH